MNYVRLYTDAAGTSHFEVVQVMQAPIAGYVKSGGTAAATILLSDPRAATSVTFGRFPAGWVAEWHPAPRRQLMTCLAGEWETTDGTRETRRFKPGDVLLLDDVEGEGHLTRIVGDEDCIVQITVLAGDAG